MNEFKMKPNGENILVVEDSPETLGLLEKFLEHEGYSVRVIPDSGMAITAAKTNPPDLVLLDIMMPGMDGYEVCAELKADETTHDIPIIFISALGEISDKVRAFSSGGIDYITKPFERREVLARVATHLQIRHLRKQLEVSNQTLENRVNERTREIAELFEEKNEMERQLQQAQKMEAIGTLAGGIAHDFNNILFAMFGYLELLIDALPKGKTREWAEDLFENANRASELVKQILTFSRKVDLKLKPLEIRIMVKEVLKLVRATLPSTIKLRSNIDEKCGMVMADPTQIHQIAMNLVINAFHAMEETGGTIDVRLARVNFEIGEIREPDMAPGDYVCLSVEDTGIGMNSHVLSRIFDPYFTTKDKDRGTGLGLAVVHGIVKNYGGQIRVCSEPGKGSVFNVYLPGIEHGTGNQAQAGSDMLKGGDERILLVDDEETIVKMEKELLESLGYHVTSRTSSVETLEAFRANPGRFDLVVTDLTMPNMTGIQLSRKLREIQPDLPIIVCTGFSESIAEEAAKTLGIRGFLKKPVLRRQLAETIRQAIENNG